MKIAYLDCMSGISGDMTLGALVDLGVPLESLQLAIDSLGLGNGRLEAQEVKKKGFRATKVSVIHEPEHAHRHLHHITQMIDQSSLTAPQKQLATDIFTQLATAEARVHGSTLEKVHFHEVGAVDSICDIVASAVGWDLLGVEQVVCSPIPTGTGFVKIAHGRVSIPAPATAELLRGIPLATSQVMAELTTPTGAAIVKTLASAFGPVPPMTIDAIGYGAGDRDLEQQANILRVLVGTSEQGATDETVWVLETNLDDVSGEVIGHATEKLRLEGALDVYTQPISMKKQRPGVILSVICQEGARERLEQTLFEETGTLGIRRWPVQRSILRREAVGVATEMGEIPGKLAILPNGRRQFKAEADACRQFAQRHGIPLREVMQLAQAAFGPQTR